MDHTREAAISHLIELGASRDQASAVTDTLIHFEQEMSSLIIRTLRNATFVDVPVPIMSTLMGEVMQTKGKSLSEVTDKWLKMTEAEQVSAAGSMKGGNR